MYICFQFSWVNPKAGTSGKGVNCILVHARIGYQLLYLRIDRGFSAFVCMTNDYHAKAFKACHCLFKVTSA